VSGLAPAARRAVAAAALVLAVSSRGELCVLGALLVLPDLWRATGPLRLVAVASAVGASAWRFGTTSLEALAGAQAVLGPAGGVGPAAAAAGSWLGAGALLLALGRGREPVRLVAAGAAVAAVLAGPAPGGQLPIRVAVGLGATVAAAGLARWRAPRPRLDAALSALAAAVGLWAVGAVAASGPEGGLTVSAGLVGQGLAIAAAVASIVLLVDGPRPRPRWRWGEGSPTVTHRPTVAPVRPDARH
jgi:hypothetical protein